MEKKVGKKPYTKPKFEFVEFSLSSSIASTCTNIGNHSDGNSCTMDPQDDDSSEWVYFSELNGACTMPMDNEYCYHVPTAETSTFSS